MTENVYSPEAVEEQEERKRRLRAYWRANTTLIRNLLLVWAFVSLGCSILFVPLLNNINFGGVPLGFWMAQQGSIFIFVILIFIYAIQMDKLDRKYRRK
jgi:putative solute:sodium symporter small subunit